MRWIPSFLAVVCLTANAQSASDAFQRAVAALIAGDYQSAEAEFQEELKKSPDNVAALENLGLIYSRKGDFDKALSTYRRALTLDPRNPSILRNVVLAHMKQGSYAEALPAFQLLMETSKGAVSAGDMQILYPLVVGYISANDTEEARRKLSAFLAGVPPAHVSLVLCKLYYERERFEDAVTACRTALALSPHLAGAHLQLARILTGQHSPQAAAELEMALREKPDDPETVYDLGVVLLEANRIPEAEKYLMRARGLDPGFWGSYFNLGKIKLKQGLVADAVPLLRRATELNPTSSAAHYELGRAFVATGQADDARRAMQRARELMADELAKEAKALRKP